MGPPPIVLATPRTAESSLQPNRVVTALDATFARFAGLEWDWDAYGAKPIQPAAIAGARGFLELLTRRYPMLDRALQPFAVVPVPDGGVQLEWRAGDREVDVEINPDGSVSYLMVESNDGKCTYQEAERIDPQEALAQVARVLTALVSG